MGCRISRHKTVKSKKGRRNRSAHDAVEAAQRHINAGNKWVVDIDMAKFFDTVNHDRLMARMKQQISDKWVLRLVNGYLKAGVMVMLWPMAECTWCARRKNATSDAANRVEAMEDATEPIRVSRFLQGKGGLPQWRGTYTI